MSELKIKRNKEKIVSLLNLNIDLKRKLLISKAKRFWEKDENFGTKKQPDIRKTKFMVYIEFFFDEDTGEKISIERNQRIEIDGKPCNEWGKEIKYFTINDI